MDYVTAATRLPSLAVQSAGLVGEVGSPAGIGSAVADIQSKLLEVQQQALRMAEENQSLREELRSQKAASDLSSRISMHDGAIWCRQDNGTEEGRYCPACWGDANKLVFPEVVYQDPKSWQLLCALHGDRPRLFKVPAHLAKCHPGAVSPAERWHFIVTKLDAVSLSALRRTFPSADQVGNTLVFNLAGNKYRLLACVDWARQWLFFRALLTHAEYDRVEPEKLCP